MVDTKNGFSVVFNDFGDSSVDLFVVFWVLVEEKPGVIAKVKEVVYNTLNKNHIEIPFPQRDVYVRHIEAPKDGKKNRGEKSKSKEVEPVESPEGAEVKESAPEQPAKRKRSRPSRKPKTKRAENTTDQ